MTLLNYKMDGQIRLGMKTEQGILPLPGTMEQVIQNGKSGLEKLREAAESAGQTIPEETIVYAPCVTVPEKILCVGVNYAEHGRECGVNLPKFPILFSKFSSALAAHRQVILLPKTAEKFDYEAELVVVIGREASCVSKEDALSYVFGYTIGNDLSARDLQQRTSQWLLGKTCDGFAPVGPYIVTADEIDPLCLDIRCEVNGELRQSSNTGRMNFDCADIISYASRYMTLKPGDILFTGTPDGVILGRPEKEQQWLKAGDKVDVSIEKIGTLSIELG